LIWWLLPLIIAAILVSVVAALRSGDGTSPGYLLF
jgi:hypothetical protein